jgi:hypothetical protein
VHPVKYVKLLLQIVGYLLRTITYGWLVDIARIIKRLCQALKELWERRKLPHPEREPQVECVRTDHPSVHRPDPCIYSQQYLLQQGLPVTWDNPDIVIKQGGVAVPEGHLLPNTLYEVEATVWNNSYDAPVAGVRVDFSFLSFGVGTTKTAIGTSFVDVGVKGSVRQPGRTSVPWTTPPTPGHYCIQVLLSWIDDANPNNNLGQNNVDVAAATSPAQFTFPLRNPFTKSARFTFRVDTYRLPAPEPCPPTQPPRETRPERIRRMVAKHGTGIGIPAGWDIAISPDAPVLAPGQEQNVQVSITPPAGFTGAQTFNVNAYGDGALAGGVTLVVTKS